MAAVSARSLQLEAGPQECGLETYFDARIAYKEV